MIRLAALAPFLLAAVLGAAPAKAMCGGNIFMTCPPPPQSAKAKAKPRQPARRLLQRKAGR